MPAAVPRADTDPPSPGRPGRFSPTLRGTLLLTDATLLAAVWGWSLRDAVVEHPVDATVLVVLTLVVGIVSAWVMSLYRYRICARRSAMHLRLVGVAAITGTFVSTVGALSPSTTAAAATVAFLALALGRASFERSLRRRRSDGRHVRDLIAVGPPDEVRRVAALLAAHPETGFRLTGFCGPAGPCPVAHLGPAADAVGAVARSGATGALVIANGMASAELNVIVRQLNRAGVPVHLSSGLEGLSHHRLHAHPLAHEPFLSVDPRRGERARLAAKRALDVALGSVLLVLSLPVLAVAAIAIRLDSPGPVIFRQHRVGRNGEVITVHKLRTMTHDAEERIADLASLNERSGPLFKITADPRVTRVGRWLRSSSIDELPQLYDAVAGRLSLVGPRPALPSEVDAFDDELREERRRLRPGITGLWQVEARNNPSFLAYRHLDLFYVENWSLRLDAVVLAATVQVVLADALGILRPRGRRPLPPHPPATEPLDRPVLAVADSPIDRLVRADAEGAHP